MGREGWSGAQDVDPYSKFLGWFSVGLGTLGLLAPPLVARAIGVHPTKHPLFSAEERKGLIQSIASHIPNVVVDSFDGLLIEYCASKNASVIVRGLRVTTDFE